MGLRKFFYVGLVFRKVLALIIKYMNIRRIIINYGFVWF